MADANLDANSDEGASAGPSGVKALKVWTANRKVRKGILADSFTELELKSRKKFNIPSNENIKFVLNADGTEIDNDFFYSLSTNSIILVLNEDEEWVTEVLPKAQGACTLPVPGCPTDGKLDDPNEKLQQIVAALRGKKRMQKKKTTMKKISVGWAHYDYKQRRYIQVRSQYGGGSPHLSIDAKSDYKESLQQISELFFTNGKSQKGKLKNMISQLGSLTGKPATPENFTIESYLSSNSKVYLLTKDKLLLPDILDHSSSEEDSDSSLPSLSPPKKECHAVDDNIQAVMNNVQPLTPLAATYTQDQQLQHVQMPMTFANARTPVTEQQLMQPQQQKNQPQQQLTLPQQQMIQPQQQQTGSFVTAGTPTVSFKQPSNVCTICMERECQSYLLPCGHVFCTVCAVHQQSTSGNCALCRQQVERVGNLFNN